MKNCPKCNQMLDLSMFYIKTGGKQTHSYCKPCVNTQTKDRQRNLKRLAVEYKGGQCQDCKQSFHFSCYDFHHDNPEEKEFTIGHRKSLKWGEEVQKELDKCILLCANCHRVRHAKY